MAFVWGEPRDPAGPPAEELAAWDVKHIAPYTETRLQKQTCLLISGVHIYYCRNIEGIQTEAFREGMFFHQVAELDLKALNSIFDDILAMLTIWKCQVSSPIDVQEKVPEISRLSVTIEDVQVHSEEQLAG